MEQKIIGNRYQIMESIGTGGMAEVYKAFDTFLNREVAVKILGPNTQMMKDLFRVSDKRHSQLQDLFIQILSMFMM